jgi:hypothetical protein
MSPAQIAVEHEAALASLTPQQLRALDRLREASQQTNFNGKFPEGELGGDLPPRSLRPFRAGSGDGVMTSDTLRKMLVAGAAVVAQSVAAWNEAEAAKARDAEPDDTHQPRARFYTDGMPD